jgi:DNA-binding transcriptional LysR family regulator
MEEFRSIVVFVRVVESGNFQKASLLLGLTPQAVGKSIRHLESRLGFRLFHRTTRKSSLTEDGQRFLESVKPNIESLSRALNTALDQQAEAGGLIRICATRSVGIQILLPLIDEFRRTHPNVTFEFITEEKITDMIESRIDIGFRSGSSPDSQVISRRLFPLRLIPCASPAYLNKFGVPASIHELQSKHVCTGYRHALTGKLMPWEFEENGETQLVSIPAVFCANESGVELEAILAGHGAGIMDSLLATPQIRSGALIPFLVDKISSRMGVYIYYPHRTDMPRRVRAFLDFAIPKLLNNPVFVPSMQELTQYNERFIQQNKV